MKIKEVREIVRNVFPDAEIEKVTVITRNGQIVIRQKQTARHAEMIANSMQARLRNAGISGTSQVFRGRSGLYTAWFSEVILTPAP